MKDLKTTWFIQHPIDQEHKQYVLLDFLKSVNQDISKEDIYYPVKKIFSLIKELTFIKVLMEEKDVDLSKASKRMKSLWEIMQESDFSKEDKLECLQILDSSLGILYKYADLGMTLWRNIERRIKVFNLPVMRKNPHSEYGILLFRNMATDEIFPYFWQAGQTGIGSRGTIMKYISIPNPYFSLSYEFSVHEIMKTMEFGRGQEPLITIMEVSEDFNRDSVILKIAKELFIREISSDKETER